MATQTVVSRTQYEVLRLFANGKTEREIADYTTLEIRAVTRTINELCAGDKVTAADMAAAYERRANAIAAARGTPGVPGLPRTTTVPPPPRAPDPATPPAMARATDVLADLLAAAQVSPHQRTRSLGAKLSALAEDLRGRLADEARAAQEAEAAAKARVEAQRRVDELAAQLEAARKALRSASGTPSPRPGVDGPGSTTPTAGPSSKAVRAWAAENGISCPAVGKVPRAVVDAYQAAQPTETDKE